ncbi:MAG TPA: hypothetical protein PKH31_15505 [Candidatus Sumerlaeota bacterium]|nr:hypothetical protein [Candidatus Sumerlaeota bacterium]
MRSIFLWQQIASFLWERKPFGFSCLFSAALFLLLLSLPGLCDGQTAPVPETEQHSLTTPHFQITASQGQLNLAYYGEACEDALKQILPDDLSSLTQPPIRVRVAADLAEFTTLSGRRQEQTLAVAIPEEGIMIINSVGLSKTEAGMREQTLGHELTHLLLGRLTRGEIRVPYWLHEGMAQLITGDRSHGGSLDLAWATATGRLIPMENLDTSFPYETPKSALAYAQSASFSDYVIRKHYLLDSPQTFFRQMAERPAKAREILLWLGRPQSIQELESGWMKEQGRLRNWIILISSTTVLWIVISLLFLLSYRLKRRREKNVMQNWDPWEREDD